MELKLLEKCLLGDQSFYFSVGYIVEGEGGRGQGSHEILKENLKLHNPSIKNIFRISNLIYFRCIRNAHLIPFSKDTTLRFLIFPFFTFQVL